MPKWVEILPAAGGIWSMIKTLRERGNHEIADKLQLAAEKQVDNLQIELDNLHIELDNIQIELDNLQIELDNIRIVLDNL